MYTVLRHNSLHVYFRTGHRKYQSCVLLEIYLDGENSEYLNRIEVRIMQANVFSLQQSFRVDFSLSLLSSQQLSEDFWVAPNIREDLKEIIFFFFLLVLYHDCLLPVLGPLSTCSCNPSLRDEYLPPLSFRPPCLLCYECDCTGYHITT